MTSSLRLARSEFIPSSDPSSDDAKRPPLHPQEIGLVAITAGHLCFLPWALGTMHVWSQLTSLGLAAAGLALAVWPRRYRDDFRTVIGPVVWPAAKLPRQAVFWAGVAFLGYIALQGLNPAWHFMSDENSWWLEPLDPVTWLPSGVDAPFERSNPWRMFVVFASLLMLVSSVWAGFSRRKTYHALFVILAANAGCLSVFGLIQRLSGTDRIFWSYLPSNPNFVSSFIYPNHAGSYLYLMFAVAVGLAWWHSQRARKRLEKRGRAAGFVFIAACCSLLVLLSYSRMSILLLLAFILGIGGSLALRLFKRAGPARSRPELLSLGLALASLVCLVLAGMHSTRLQRRFALLITDPTAATWDRTLPRRAAEEMLQDNWLYGWGAGCFQYGFSKYTKKYPEVHFFPHGPRRLWEHVHNDLVEFPVEFGVVGMLPVVVVLGYALWGLFRRRFWTNVISLSLVLGCSLVVLHAWVDFVFQNPAILLTWGVLLAGALRWLELDHPGSRTINREPLNPRTECTPARAASSPV